MSTDLPVGYNGMEPAEIPIEEKRVGFGKRLGATLLDGLIVGLIAVIVSLALGSTLDTYVDGLITKQLEEIPNAADMPELAINMMRYGIMFGVVAGGLGLLLSLVELFMGASIGKMILGIAIAKENGARGNITVWGIRWILKQSSGILSFIGTILAIKAISNISSVIGLAYLVGCFFVLGVKRQALHDTISKTAVYEKEDITD